MNRREFIKRLVVSSFLLATSATAAYEILARLGGTQQPVPSVISSQSTQSSQAGSGTTSQTQVPPGYVFVTALASLSGKTSAYFQHPNYGYSLLINVGSQWKGFSATCTHQPCTVQYGGSTIQCPCHGASFSTSNGGVLGGPAPRPLPEFGVLVQNGDLYVTTAAVN